MLQLNDLNSYIQTLKPEGVSLITLHWTVGLPDQLFDSDYHFQIVSNGDIHVDPRAFDSSGNFVPLAHAWHHNTANIGISICGMYNAVQPSSSYTVDPNWEKWPIEYGKNPPTRLQMLSMIILTSLLIKHYNIQLSNVYSHYQLSLIDGYPGERWEYIYELAEIKTQIQKLV
jgi:hypothetical protein